MDAGAVVGSMKGWDGVRVLGVFDDEATAIRVCKEAGIDVESEEFCLDFVQKNKVSICQNLLLNESTLQKGFRRVHVYDYPENNPET